MPFNGSEDLGFNGMGGLAGKNGGNIILVDADGTEMASYADAVNPSYGLRYTIDGDLLVAHPGQGEIAQIGSDGSIGTFATGIGGVNGLYPDLDGNVWVTNFSIVGRYSADGTLDTLVSGGDAANSNGIVFDPDRSVAFYTNYSAGRVLKVDINEDGSAGAIAELGAVGGAAFDGLALDACGNLYAVDNATPRVFRLMLDENADAVGDLTNIVDGNMQNVANAQFGRGDGFDANSLYVTGNPGVVYRLEVGVPGAEIPLP
jgi:sugar lactone lactonase YvrE